MRDPFEPPERGLSTQFLLLGAHCALCKAAVCVDSVRHSLTPSQRGSEHDLRTH